MSGGKLFVLVVWIVFAALAWLSSGWLAVIGQLVLASLIISHPIEFIVKLDLFRRIGGSMLHHFVQTMIFGLFYWRPLETQP